MSNLELSPTDDLSRADVETLLNEIRARVFKAQKEATLAGRAEVFSPIEEFGQRIRAERKKQHLTLNDLSELSGVAYATLSKIEQGHKGIRLDSISKVANALGMKLWIG